MIMIRSRTRSRITYQVHWVKGLIISPYWLAQMVHKELFKIPPEIFLKVPNKYNFSLDTKILICIAFLALDQELVYTK